MTTNNTGADVPATGWAERIKAALENKTAPAYADLEAGLAIMLNQNKELQSQNLQLMDTKNVLISFSQEVSEVVSKMAVARHRGRTDEALAALDDFIQKRVIVKEVPESGKAH